MTIGQDDHQKMAQKRKEFFEKKRASANIEKGLLIVNTGTGKGKTTAAMGMGVRVLGHGLKLGIVQFIKGAMYSAERDLLGNHENCEFYTIGDGYTWNTQDQDMDVRTAQKAWSEAVRMINDPSFNMVILDELNAVLKYKYLDLQEVLNTFSNRRANLHIVVTGRHALPELIEAADLVSEINPIKHPYREQGVKAQKGVEF